MEPESSNNLPLTLEDHFENLASASPRVKNLHSLWVLFRKDMEDLLPHSRSVYVHYSLHDAIHSRSVIQAIERFLGEERMKALSATDTFMLLVCAYAHDYGMAMTFNLIYDALGTRDFLDFLKNQKDNGYALPADELQAVKNLLSFVNDRCKSSTSLQELYFSIMVVIQTYLRPSHWKGIERIWNDFGGLFEGRLNGRFIQGMEGIVEICEAHGKSFSDVMKMRVRADGIVGDEFHPRFIAAMLRLGDLLDLDNGRFPRWFVNEISQNRGLIPKLSELHHKKHEAVSHLLITPKRIEVCASCDSSNDGYEVAGLVREWLEWLETECKDQRLYWSVIAQPDFGRPPQLTKADILIDGRNYASKNYRLQMRMSQNRVMKLLEGTSIYKDQYIGIRELVQNAVDASLLQLWYDVTQNRYFSIGISKFGHKINDSDKKTVETKASLEEDKRELALLEWEPDVLHKIFKNYSITVELIHDKKENVIQIVIKDKGTGITPDDVQHMSDIGTSKEKNEKAREIMKNMPCWLKPSGVFGIGLQSAFQLTNQIEFFTRRPNEPERQIIFHSYGRNHGKIEIREVPPDTDGVYYNNAIPGTNVKITVSPEKIHPDQPDQDSIHDPFHYYDMEFDEPDLLHGLFVEFSNIIDERLRECPCDFFDIYFRTMEKLEDGTIIKNYRSRCRYSYFSPLRDGSGPRESSELKLERNSILPFFTQPFKKGAPFSFSTDNALFADEKTYRIHHLTLRVGEVHQNGTESIFELPEPVPNLYHFQYKFNPIANTQFVYPPDVRKLRNLHAGFLCWKVNIMDDKPEKYLNIDRDRLRDGAIYEEELIQTRKHIMQTWCEYFIHQYEARESARVARNKTGQAVQKYRGNEKGFKPELSHNIFSNSLETLISLALLFYQDVPEERFHEFMKPYRDCVLKKNWKLQNETFTVEKLWDKGSVFKLASQGPSRWISAPHVQEFTETEDPALAQALPISLSTIARLPHRLIHVSGISRNAQGNVSYSLTLNPNHHDQQEPDLIYMNYLAQVYDYCDAISPQHNNKKEDADIDSLVRKIFKPNRKYPHLVVSEYPVNFLRGDNFSLPLDYCIQGYILSPFDRQLTKWLRELLMKKSPSQDGNGVDRGIREEVEKEVQMYMKQSDQARRCVDYVYKKKAKSCQEETIWHSEPLKELIEKEYTGFLQECCMILFEHRDQIINRRRKEKEKKKNDRSREWTGTLAYTIFQSKNP
ncbi:HD domain-containing protein [Acutalibacter caecimuris]|uniref:HD domain-containing protein n=1 Tax=Acutalibacter caecimuris TaxID=3093657 RepID=UPI003F585A9B